MSTTSDMVHRRTGLAALDLTFELLIEAEEASILVRGVHVACTAATGGECGGGGLMGG